MTSGCDAGCGDDAEMPEASDADPQRPPSTGGVLSPLAGHQGPLPRHVDVTRLICRDVPQRGRRDRTLHRFGRRRRTGRGARGRPRRPGSALVLGVGVGAPTYRMPSTISGSSATSRRMRPRTTWAEITARTNDEGWETSFDARLRTSRLSSRDALLVFSVGGGTAPQRLGEPRPRDRAGTRGRRRRLRDRRTRGRATAAGGGCLHRRGGAAGAAHAPCGGVPGDRPASSGFASGTCDGARKVGVVRGRGSRVSNPAVFLDCDGVIVELVWDDVDGAFEGPTVEEDVRLVAGAADAVGRSARSTTVSSLSRTNQARRRARPRAT